MNTWIMPLLEACALVEVDVTTTTDAGLLGADDRAHLAFALAEGRVVFTNDADFLRLASFAVPHAGIVYSAPGHMGVGEIVRLLCLLSDCLTPAEMDGKVEFV